LEEAEGAAEAFPEGHGGLPAERARGQYWGVKTIDSFHYYGTPDVTPESAE